MVLIVVFAPILSLFYFFNFLMVFIAVYLTQPLLTKIQNRFFCSKIQNWYALRAMTCAHEDMRTQYRYWRRGTRDKYFLPRRAGHAAHAFFVLLELESEPHSLLLLNQRTIPWIMLGPTRVREE